LVQRLGPTHEASLLIAVHGLLLVSGAQGHAQRDELVRQATGVVGACLEARGVHPEQAQQWLEERQLLDQSLVVPALRAALEALVPDDGWLFDRDEVLGRGRS
ncbi:MAG TPA: hypothetical protein VL337_09795, partial [Acidimicrobiales bacterium]|nr:hypothetical protein [Acidimicrobiales bacterium]